MSFNKHNHEIIAVIGAGSWGLTLSRLFSEAGKKVLLYTGNREKIKSLSADYKIDKPLSVTFSRDRVAFTDDLACAVESASVLIICCTSQSMRSVAKELAVQIADRPTAQIPTLISAVKGLELHSFRRMSEIIKEEIPQANVCALSGPNLAVEILHGLPTATVIAGTDKEIIARVQQILNVPKFRLYSNMDIIGVELGGTLKNVIAIAAGGSDGLNLGANAKAALLTRGLAEMTRLAVHLGAKPNTLAGLAGMGDLLATCSGPLSRNYRLGMEMARGKSLQTVLQETGAVIEGVTTTEAVCELNQTLNIELPIARLVQASLDGSLTPADAIMALMSRPLVSE